MAKLIACFAACSGFLAVALGAFAAHGLKQRISESLLSAFSTGVQYQFYHTIVLLALSFYMLTHHASKLLITSSICFVIGILLFSGSLYFIALGGPRWMGPITPLGGLFFMVGWLVLASYFVMLLVKPE